MQYFESGRQYRFVSTASIPFVFKQKTAGATIIEIVIVCLQDEKRSAATCTAVQECDARDDAISASGGIQKNLVLS